MLSCYVSKIIARPPVVCSQLEPCPAFASCKPSSLSHRNSSTGAEFRCPTAPRARWPSYPVGSRSLPRGGGVLATHTHCPAIACTSQVRAHESRKKHRRPRAAQNKDVVPLIADQVFQPAVVHAPRRPAPKRKSLNKKAPKRAKAKTVVKRARGSGNRGGSRKGGGRKSGRR